MKIEERETEIPELLERILRDVQDLIIVGNEALPEQVVAVNELTREVTKLVKGKERTAGEVVIGMAIMLEWALQSWIKQVKGRGKG